MTLTELEFVARLLDIGHFTRTLPEEVLRRNQVDPVIQQLLDDGQFYALLELRRAEQHAERALEALTVQTEYLRAELVQHLLGLQALLQKIEREEHLRRDRDALLAL